MARFKTINDICNQVAIEVGVPKTPDVFSSQDSAFAQLTALANACGYELLQDEDWEGLTREHKITTQIGDTGKYDLPDDFAYMTNQTGWDRTNNEPLKGPLSPQEWTYLKGRDLVSETIYVSFRELENQFWIFPSPPPAGLDITFEYTSRNWVLSTGTVGEYADMVNQPSDVVLYESYLFERLLKTRFLEARGFDSTSAAGQYNSSIGSWKSKDKGGRILNAGRGARGAAYLNGYSVPDTGYGKN